MYCCAPFIIPFTIVVMLMCSVCGPEYITGLSCIILFPTQPYTINSSNALFLNCRPQASPMKGKSCVECGYNIKVAFDFCSLNCKVFFRTFSNFFERFV